VALDSSHRSEELGDGLMRCSVVIAGFLGKAKGGKEDERRKNYDPAIQFQDQLMCRIGAPHNGRNLEDLGDEVMLLF
jgi:hypothetical protein